jgi:hypothetical protein
MIRGIGPVCAKKLINTLHEKARDCAKRLPFAWRENQLRKLFLGHAIIHQPSHDRKKT